MPLVRISLISGKSSDFKRELSQLIYEAMRETINIPENDKFQVISEHDKDNLIYSPDYLGINRSEDIIIIQIVLNEGRSLDLKKQLYKKIADDLNHRLNIRKEDVFINLIEVPKENWSLGNGLAQYAN
ncbi:tautomerase family protein [bacterium LRH843]|nr:tautomerase family protein [bacterium LRH843]